MSRFLLATSLLLNVESVLKTRGIDADVDGHWQMFVGDRMVSRVIHGKVQVLPALVFDGHAHVVPPGCDSSTVTTGSRYATVDRIVAAIEKRMAARSKSLPVPVDATAITRDPGEEK